MNFNLRSVAGLAVCNFLPLILACVGCADSPWLTNMEANTAIQACQPSRERMLRIDSLPQGAAVIINGERYGATPTSLNIMTGQEPRCASKCKTEMVWQGKALMPTEVCWKEFCRCETTSIAGKAGNRIALAYAGLQIDWQIGEEENVHVDLSKEAYRLGLQAIENNQLKQAKDYLENVAAMGLAESADAIQRLDELNRRAESADFYSLKIRATEAIAGGQLHEALTLLKRATTMHPDDKDLSILALEVQQRLQGAEGLPQVAGQLPITPANQSGVDSDPQAKRDVSVVYKAPPQGNRGLEGETVLYKRSYAVVIGISKYGQGMPEITGATDAQRVAQALRKHGFRITSLIDGEASRGKIADVLGDSLPNMVGPDDRVLVYFAGHGTTLGEGEKAMGYVMPADSRKDKAVSTGLSMRELMNWFDAYKSKHVMFVADACYSGLAINTRSLGLGPTKMNYLREVTAMPARLALVAGTKGEQANEFDGQGLFTKFFLSGLDGSADLDGDGIITFAELEAYVKPNVSQFAMSRLSRPQHPQTGRSGEGEFIFLSPRKETAPKKSSAEMRETLPSTKVSPAAKPISPKVMKLPGMTEE